MASPKISTSTKAEPGTLFAPSCYMAMNTYDPNAPAAERLDFCFRLIAAITNRHYNWVIRDDDNRVISIAEWKKPTRANLRFLTNTLRGLGWRFEIASNELFKGFAVELWEGYMPTETEREQVSVYNGIDIASLNEALAAIIRDRKGKGINDIYSEAKQAVNDLRARNARITAAIQQGIPCAAQAVGIIAPQL